jgi:hypothetical protein
MLELFEDFRHGLFVGHFTGKHFMRDRQTVWRDQQSQFNLLQVRTMGPGITVFGNRAAVAADMCTGHVVEHQGQLEVQEIGHFPVQMVFDLRLDIHEIIQGPVKILQFPALRCIWQIEVLYRQEQFTLTGRIRQTIDDHGLDVFRDIELDVSTSQGRPDRFGKVQLIPQKLNHIGDAEFEHTDRVKVID